MRQSLEYKPLKNKPYVPTSTPYLIYKLTDLINSRKQRQASAIINNEPSIVIDCRYLAMHSRDDVKLSIEKQFKKIIDANGDEKNKTCFQLHFCNYPIKSEFHKRFGSQLGLDENLVLETGRSYLDLFPKEELVYLSPNADTPMTEYDPSKVYIIGSIVDYEWKKFDMVTLDQAKKDGIACECLPIDQNLRYLLQLFSIEYF